MYINAYSRPRRRRQVFVAFLVALGLVICLLPAPDHAGETATASTSPTAIKAQSNIS